jgi:hypothetical protein
MAKYLIATVFLIPGALLAHGGGLNAEGCHNNRKTGDYHCHRAPSSASVPQRLAPERRQEAQTARPRPETPTCYVGPRGGTYTITSSGRKNYGGC